MARVRTSDLPSPAVRRLLCDGAVVGIVDDAGGTPLSIGRRTRTVPVGMRRALEARETAPVGLSGVPATNSWLDAHHVVHWADGGETNLENLILLCTHHHKLLHEGEFQILRHETKGALAYFARIGREGRCRGGPFGGAFRHGRGLLGAAHLGTSTAWTCLKLCGVPDVDSPASADSGG